MKLHSLMQKYVYPQDRKVLRYNGTWCSGTIIGYWWWNWTIPKRVLKILRNPGSTDIQENFATDFKRSRASPLQQCFRCVSTVNGLEINRKFPRLFSRASNETQNSQKYLIMTHKHDLPIGGHLHLRHNFENNKWLRHNFEQNFHAEVLDSVFTK